MSYKSSFLLLAASLASCATAIDPSGDPAADPGSGTRAHIMPLHASDPVNVRAAAAAAKAHLTYYGGPVLSNVKVVQVNWGGSNVSFASELNGFYSAVTNSAYFDWLSEYNTPTQQIGRGSFAGAVDDTSVAGTSLSDAQIQQEIGRLVSTGKVPAADDNTIYMVHFAPGVSISMSDGSQSCVQFCAYHSTFTQGGRNIYYGIIPDQNAGGCASGCGGGTAFENTTSTTSHELIEAVTDAAVGLATTNGPPLAWYDTKNGEIGDICVTGTSYTGVVAGYTVQKEWSNKAGACIVTSGSTPPPPADGFSVSASPSSATVQPGSTVSYTITTAVTSGSAQTVSLAVSGLPSGVTGSFRPTSVTGAGTSTLTLTASAAAAAATKSFTVTGTAPSGSHTASASVTVSATTPPPPPDDFTIAVSPVEQSVAAGSSVTFTVTTGVASGNPGTIALSVSGLPSGVTGSFRPTTVAAGDSSTLTLTADAAAAAATARFTVGGTDGSNVHTAGATVDVTTSAPPPPPSDNLVSNGDFETGYLSPWHAFGSIGTSARAHHGGSYSARLGSSSWYGDSVIYQAVDVPADGTTTLDFWTERTCRDPNYSWSYVAGYIVDESSYILDTLFEDCANDYQTWNEVTADLTDYAGSTVYVYFDVYDDGLSFDAAWMYIDDVVVTNR